MRRDIDVTLLRAFIAVAETGGMTSAGRLLNLTQAAVSQQIKRLEELFGAELFDRGEKRLRLTSAGERLKSHAQQLVALNDEVFGLMTSPEFEGEVVLGVPHDIVGVYLPPILRCFGQTHPRVRVSLVSSTTTKLLAALEAGTAQLTLTTEHGAAPAPDMLLADPLVWAGARGGNAHLRDPLPVAFGDETCAFRAQALEALRKAGRRWHLSCLTGDTAPLYATLQADMAVAPVLASTVPPELEILRPSPKLGALPLFHINLRLPPAGATPLALALAQHIREEFACRWRQAA